MLQRKQSKYRQTDRHKNGRSKYYMPGHFRVGIFKSKFQGLKGRILTDVFIFAVYDSINTSNHRKYY